MTSKLRLFVLLFFFIAVAAGAEEKRADEMPALAAKSLVVTPAYPQPEEAAEAVLTIENSSTGPAEKVEVLFYANGELLASRTVTIDALSGATVSVPWTAKGAGTTTLVAKIDPGQELIERDRHDNAFVLDVVTSAAPAVEADFALTAIEVLAPAGSPGSLRVDVANEGTVAASAPLVIRRNGQPVQVVDTGFIDAGKSTTIEVPWSDPDRGKMSAEVNPRWAEAEPSSKNNTIAASPATDGVDLRIEQLAFHAPQDEEKQTRRIGIHFRIVNDGAQDVKQPFRTRIDPGAIDKDGKLIPAYVDTAALPAGGTVYVSHIFESAPDKFTVNAEADADKEVAETDEQNNLEVKDFYNDTTLGPDRWVNIGPRRIINGDTGATGRLSTMAIHPTQPSTMYVGAQLSGVWKTTNGGASWVSLGESATVRVAALALAPDNPSRVYLVTPNDGVFRSDDAGTSWTQISRTDLAAMVHAGSALLINPAAPNEMVVSSWMGAFRSSDGGVTWTRTLSGGSCTSLIRMAANGRLYAALRNDEFANLAGVYESVNWGASWSLVPQCPTGALPSADAKANIRLAASGTRLFVTYLQDGDPKTFRLFRSTSLTCGAVAGPTFEAGWQANAETAPGLWSGVWADPGNSANVYMLGTRFWRSTNAGSSFSVSSAASGNAHADHHHLGFDPNTRSTIYSLNDGGIYRSTNRGVSGSWELLGDGITNVEFYDGVAAPTDAGLLIGGNQDNGTLKGITGDSVWSKIKDGDGATVDIDPTNTSIMYAMHQYVNSVSRSADGGGTFNLITNGLITGSQCFNLHYQVHPNQPNTLLLSCWGLWRTTDSGANWSLFFVPQTNRAVRTAIDGAADTYYTGTNGGEIWRKPAGGSSTSIFQHWNRAGLTDLEINPANPTRLYASFGGTGRRRIVRLVQTSIWGEFSAQDITSDLPGNLFVRTIAIDKNYPFTIYAGTDRGVYQGRSLDHGFTWFWRPYMNGMPPADVRDLEVHPTTGIMRAFTHGRSAFEVTTSRTTSDQVE